MDHINNIIKNNTETVNSLNKIDNLTKIFKQNNNEINNTILDLIIKEQEIINNVVNKEIDTLVDEYLNSKKIIKILEASNESDKLIKENKKLIKENIKLTEENNNLKLKEMCKNCIINSLKKKNIMIKKKNIENNVFNYTTIDILKKTVNKLTKENIKLKNK